MRGFRRGKVPPPQIPQSVPGAVFEAYAAASPRLCHEGVWVMGRGFYDRLRAETFTEDMERKRAASHASAWVPVADPVRRCPVCVWPVSGRDAVLAHLAQLSDPAFRDPGPVDVLMGRPIRVVPGDDPPRLVERS